MWKVVVCLHNRLDQYFSKHLLCSEYLLMHKYSFAMYKPFKLPNSP